MAFDFLFPASKSSIKANAVNRTAAVLRLRIFVCSLKVVLEKKKSRLSAILDSFVGGAVEPLYALPALQTRRLM